MLVPHPHKLMSYRGEIQSILSLALVANPTSCLEQWHGMKRLSMFTLQTYSR